MKFKDENGDEWQGTATLDSSYEDSLVIVRSHPKESELRKWSKALFEDPAHRECAEIGVKKTIELAELYNRTLGIVGVVVKLKEFAGMK